MLSENECHIVYGKLKCIKFLKKLGSLDGAAARDFG